MLTYFDLVESLIVSSYGGPQDAEQRDIRTAIHRAYDELTTLRDWNYYQTHGRVITDEPFQTGTVTFVKAENSLGLSSGSFPSWAAYGHVRVGTRIVAVKQFGNNDGELILDSDVTFPADFSNQPFVLYRLLYPLPSDFRNLDEPTSEYNWSSGLYVSPDEALKIERVARSTGLPYHWTVLPDPDGSGWALKLIGYPTRVETVDFMYRRSARAIRYSGHEPTVRQGTITRSSISVTGSGTAFTSAMVGSVLRVGTTADIPGPIESLSPWVSESKISTFLGATSLRTEAGGTIAAGTKYLITDPIDVAPHMERAMDSACQYYLARIRGKDEDKKFQLYQRDLRLALERDQMAPLSGRTRHIYTDGGWRSPLKVDGGV